MKQKIAKISAYNKINGMYVKREGFLKRQFEKITNPNLLRCDWDDLKNTKIHNQNIYISDFDDVHPLSKPPIFDNAKVVFLDNNYHYFHLYWLKRIIFPSNPVFYINGYINYACVLESGFKIFLTPHNYGCAKLISPNNDLIDKIEIEDYNKLLNEYEAEKIISSKY